MDSVFNKAIPLSSKRLSEVGIIHTYHAGDVVIREHSENPSVPIITKGNIKVMQTDDDHREILLYYLQPGETCIMSFLGGLFHTSANIRAVAEEDSEVIFIPPKEFQKLIKEDQNWLNYILKVYHQRYMELLAVVSDVAFKNLDERILQFLQKRSHLTGSKVLTITHDQIAQELGSAREVISRLLKQMEHKGLIELERNRIVLV